MTFNPTLELTNEMIQFGSQLDYQDYSEYQFVMIQKFYPDADINVINQMTEWAKYPTFNLITLDVLKHIEITACEKVAKINGADYSHMFDTVSNVTSICHANNSRCKLLQVGRIDLGMSWNQLDYITLSGYNLVNQNGTACFQCITMGCKFVIMIRCIWDANHNSSQIIIDLQSEVDLLKQKNADLSYQVQLTAYSLSILQPANPVYDYHAIKSRKQKLHQEFKRLSKLMKLG
jgi:hypothetical protein